MRVQLCVLAVAGMIGIACDGSPIQPHLDGPSPPSPPAPLSGAGTITVEVLPFSHSLCAAPAGETCAGGAVLLNDSEGARLFTAPGTLRWTDVQAGQHTLYLYGGLDSGSDDRECRFLWKVGAGTYYAAPRQIVVRGGDTLTFQVGLTCV